MTSSKLTVHGFETSNNMKVRVALGYKSIPYEFRTIDSVDRDEIVRISGQYLTPIIEHGDVVLCDSGAIMRYLDIAFRDTPKLFGHSRLGQWEIEDWELFAKHRMAGPMMRIVHVKIAGGAPDAATKQACADDFASALSELAQQIGDRDWVVGEELTAADIHAATILHRVQVAQMFEMPPQARELDAWRERVMAYDGVSRIS